MNMDHVEPRKKVGEGRNRLLGKLICFSCQKHCRCSCDDKHLWIEEIYDALIFSDGRFELWTRCDDNKELDAFMLTEISSITEKQLIPSGQGVAVEFYDTRLECSSCGSQEFLPLSS